MKLKKNHAGSKKMKKIEEIMGRPDDSVRLKRKNNGSEEEDTKSKKIKLDAL